jgi:hypothetical protein
MEPFQVLHVFVRSLRSVIRGLLVFILNYSLLPAFAQDHVYPEELAPHLFRHDHYTYHQGTAIQMAALSELAYWNEHELGLFFHALKDRYPEEPWEFRFLSDKRSHAQALLVRYNDRLVIAFRGTEFKACKDLFNDVKFLTYTNRSDADPRIQGLPTGHGGFRRAIINLICQQDLIEVMNDMIARSRGAKDAFPIYLTGHSLGAAMGSMFSGVLDTLGYNMSGAYFFAPPLGLAPDEACRLERRYGNTVHEIVNYKDYVPRALATNRCRYRHSGVFYRIGSDGALRVEPEKYVKMSCGERKVKKYHRLLAHRAALVDPVNSADGIMSRMGQESFPNNDRVKRACSTVELPTQTE